MPEHKTFRIPVFVTAEEKERIEAVAQSTGQKSSPFMRSLALDAANKYEAGK